MQHEPDKEVRVGVRVIVGEWYWRMVLHHVEKESWIIPERYLQSSTIFPKHQDEHLTQLNI